MANVTIIPTRMELTRLKKKLKTAQRGHKLLKDKRDELMKSFLETVRSVRALRAEVEEELMTVHRSFTVASAQERISDPRRRNSSFKRPTAFSSWSERRELEQQSSAK